MPTSLSTAEAGQGVACRRALRLAAGTAFAMCVSQAFGWPLSFIAPIITLVILGLPSSRPPAKFFMSLVVAITAAIYGSFLFLPLLLHYRVAGLILLAVALFHTFYLTARGKPPVIGTLLTMGITLTVAIGSVSVDGLIAAAEGVVVGTLVGAAVAWLMHALLPDPPLDQPAPQPPANVPRNPVRLALRSLAVVFPVTVWFVLSPGSASSVAVMIKVAAMGQEATGEGARTAARSLLFSTVAGGIAAVLAWQVLTIWPTLTLYTLLVAIASLWFSARTFAGYGLAPDGATWNYALLTMIVILAPAVLDSQFGSAANASFYQRLFMLMGASLYGVAAVQVFDAFWPPAGTAVSRESAGTAP